MSATNLRLTVRLNNNIELRAHMITRTRVLLLTAAFLLLSGCIPYATRQPKDEELVGRFVGKDGSYFVLSADKKIELHQIPEVLIKSTFEARSPITAVGVWKIEDRSLAIELSKVEGKATPIRYFLRIPISEKHHRFGLMIEVDAGDGGYLEYERSK